MKPNKLPPNWVKSDFNRQTPCRCKSSWSLDGGVGAFQEGPHPYSARARFKIFKKYLDTEILLKKKIQLIID